MLHSLPQLSGSPILRCSRFTRSTDLNSHREQPLLESGHSTLASKTVGFGSTGQSCGHRQTRRPEPGPLPFDLLQQQLQQRLELQRQKSATTPGVKGMVVGANMKGISPGANVDVSQTIVCPGGSFDGSNGGQSSGNLVGKFAGSVGSGAMTGQPVVTMSGVSTGLAVDSNPRPTSDIGLSSAGGQYERPCNMDRYSAPPLTNVAVKPGSRPVARYLLHEQIHYVLVYWLL
jgi:hypothetical protein